MRVAYGTVRQAAAMFLKRSISEAREHLGDVVGRARHGGEGTILTHYGAPAAVVIGFEEYRRLKLAKEDDRG